jgi:hypothetical protein
MTDFQNLRNDNLTSKFTLIYRVSQEERSIFGEVSLFGTVSEIELFYCTVVQYSTVQ